MQKSKIFLSILLVLSMLFVGNLSVNIYALTDSLKWDGMVYITEKNDVPSNIAVYMGKDSKNQDKYENLELKYLNPNLVEKIGASDYENVCVDGKLADNEKVKEKIIESYQKGAKIIIRENDIKLSDIYTYFGINYDNANRFASDIDSQSADKLKVIGIAISKDESGTINTTIIRAENYSNEKKVQEAIAYSLKTKMKSNGSMLNRINYDKKLISFKNAVYAVGTDPGWPILASNTWVDSWATVTLNYGVFLETSPNNPQGGYYWYINYTNVTLTPAYRYAIGDMYFYQDAGGAIVQDYAPKPQTNSNISISVGAPLNASFSYSSGQQTQITTTGMTGTAYTQWDFHPTVLNWPITSQVSEELITEYKRTTQSYNIGFSYTIKMYKYESLTGLYTYYADANISGVHVSN